MISLGGMWMKLLFPNTRSTSDEGRSRNEQEVQHNYTYERSVISYLIPNENPDASPTMVDCRSFRL